MTTIKLPNQKKISITALANCIAESLHPLPTEIKWAVEVNSKIVHLESGDVLEPMTEADFAFLADLCKQCKLPSLVCFNELNDVQIEAWITPYQTALAGKKWKQAWTPFFETRCNAHGPELKQHEARVAQHDELREVMQRGEIKAFNDNGRTVTDISTASILMADAVTYCENKGWGTIIVGAEPAQEAAYSAPMVIASDCTAQSTIIHSTRSRRNALTPVIEQAQKQCNNPKDTAAVWAALQVLAEQKTPPLIGATEDGLQYLKNGAAASFNRDALRKRLSR